MQVPGAFEEAMNGQTKLGKAVRAACSELKTLNELVRASPYTACAAAPGMLHTFQPHGADDETPLSATPWL
jgi:hypothetical protein